MSLSCYSGHCNQYNEVKAAYKTRTPSSNRQPSYIVDGRQSRKYKAFKKFLKTKLSLLCYACCCVTIQKPNSWHPLRNLFSVHLQRQQIARTCCRPMPSSGRDRSQCSQAKNFQGQRQNNKRRDDESSSSSRPRRLLQGSINQASHPQAWRPGKLNKEIVRESAHSHAGSINAQPTAPSIIPLTNLETNTNTTSLRCQTVGCLY